MAGLVALWSLIAALIFTGSLLTWLVLADAIALGVVALVDLARYPFWRGNGAPGI